MRPKANLALLPYEKSKVLAPITSPHHFPVQRPVLNGLRHMGSPDTRITFKVCDGSGNLQDGRRLADKRIGCPSRRDRGYCHQLGIEGDEAE